MIKAKVYLIEKNHLSSLEKVLVKILPSCRKESWAIKLHMGEYGNLNYVRPPIVGKVVSVLKSKGINPFLFDTTTLYKGSRYTVKSYLETARQNGFTKETIGCPIVISNRGVVFRGKNIKKIFVAEPIFKSKGIVILSHFKGHPEAGFGGAIKNLGMGGVTRETKAAVHSLSHPILDSEKCIGCGTCVKVCPEGALKIIKGKSKIDYEKCFGCGVCIVSCPTKALRVKVANLRALLAEAAGCILSNFDEKRVFYINVLMNISERCDCFPIGGTDPGRILCPDIGILVSRDIIAIEKASFDLVNKRTDGKFSRLYIIKGEEQIKVARKLGLGTDRYELKTI